MWRTIDTGTPEANMVKSHGSAHSSVLTLYWSARATSCGSWYLSHWREVACGRWGRAGRTAAGGAGSA